MKKPSRSVLCALAALAAAVGLAAGCSRGGAKAVDPADGEKKDYKEMLERTRAKKAAKEGVFFLQGKVQEFQLEYGRLPQSLGELLARGYVEKIPAPPDGYQYRYDPALGNVGIARNVMTPDDIAREADFESGLLEE